LPFDRDDRAGFKRQRAPVAAQLERPPAGPQAACNCASATRAPQLAESEAGRSKSRSTRPAPPRSDVCNPA
jgi:hypothetical protein